MREYYRKKLNNLLGAAKDEEFIQLLWATNALQSDYEGAARQYIRPETIPDGAVTTEMLSRYFIQKWEIETLANELMTSPKLKPSKNGRIRKLHCDHFGAIVECTRWLRKLENVEYRVQKRRQSVFIEMVRIASRQFGWQRGYVNIPQFYRNAFVYGQGECASYFERQHKISFNRFSQIGFMLFVAFTNSPVVRNDRSWVDLGITWEEVTKVLALVSMPFHEAARLAREKRGGVIHTADKPSILRQAPCLRFGVQGERVRAPLPELVLERITSGVFYDVVNGGGSIRADYGKRFEDYCFRYLFDTLPRYSWEREGSYRKKSNSFSTPDVLCSSNGKLEVAFECKATRMSQEAMFGKDPIAARGYEDITKAVFQLWRFFSHCRQGYSGYRVDESAVGVVLTLDNWLVTARTLRERVIEDARRMIGEKELEFIDVDRRPILFVTISELEIMLSMATESTFKECLMVANTEKYIGWQLDSIHKDLYKDEERESRGYPYAGDLGSLLPWWNAIENDSMSAGS